MALRLKSGLVILSTGDEAISRLDSSLYTLKKVGTDGCQYKLYTANYQLPFAMATDSSVKNVDFNKDFTKNEATMSVESEDYNDKTAQRTGYICTILCIVH